MLFFVNVLALKEFPTHRRIPRDHSKYCDSTIALREFIASLGNVEAKMAASVNRRMTCINC